MASRRWCGRAAKVPQVATHTPASVGIGDTFWAEINGRRVTYTAAAATVADVCTGLVALLQACTFPEFKKVTWSDETTYIGSIGPETGEPVTITTGAAGGTATNTTSVTTTATGPNWINNAANWKENAVPGAADDAIVDEGPSILWGLDQLSGTLASFRVGLGFPSSSEIGLPPNTSPDNPDLGYPEYLPQRLGVNATIAEIESNSPRIRLDFGTVATTITVNGTGQSRSGEHALDIIAVNSSNVIRVNAGDVGIACGAAEVSTIGTFASAFRSNVSGDANCELGRGVTLTTLLQTGGNVLMRCGATTVTREGGGTMNRVGTGTITTLNNRAGDFQDDGTGTITNFYNSAVYNRRGLAALTVTNATVYGGSVTTDPTGTVTWTNPVNFFECSPSSGNGTQQETSAVAYFDFGRHRKIAVTDI